MADLAALRAIVGAAHLTEGAALAQRPQDFWNPVPTRARALARPGDRQELSALLALCNRTGQKVIVEGGRTNLVHATAGDTDTLLISLERMDAIGTPDPEGMVVEVGAGAILESVQARAAASGLRFGLDFGARGSATIGGALSTNAGGFQALRYGVARDQVLGLECVLADGTILSHLTPYPKDNTGYDLKQLMIGSEGTLGVITRAMLRLHPLPTTAQTALLGFQTFADASASLRALRHGLLGTLSAFEIIWPDFLEQNIDALMGGRSPLGGRYPFYALCEMEGFSPDRDAGTFEGLIGRLIEEGKVADASLATSERQRAELWRLREDFTAELALLRNMVDFDTSIPVPRMEAFATELKARLDAEVPDNYGLHIFGHMGDANLHLATGLPDPADAHRVKELTYELIARHGGSVSAEHGVGLTKREFLPYSRSQAELALMRRLKEALDPAGILNPGKVIAV